jgi:hypothetical protein
MICQTASLYGILCPVENKPVKLAKALRKSAQAARKSQVDGMRHVRGLAGRPEWRGVQWWRGRCWRGAGTLQWTVTAS